MNPLVFFDEHDKGFDDHGYSWFHSLKENEDLKKLWFD